MTIVRRKSKSSFTILDNKIFNSDLSFNAVGVLSYILSKPDHWKIQIQDLVNQSKDTAKPLGKKSFYTIINELISKGFCERKLSERGDKGVFTGYDYIIHDIPVDNSESQVQEGADGEALGGMPLHGMPLRAAIVSTELLTNTEVNKNICKIENLDKSKAKEFRSKVRECWDQYPEHRRGGNDSAFLKKIKTLKLTEKDLDDIFSDLLKRKEGAQWKSDGGKYVQGVTKYLNESIWKTPIESPVQQKSTGWSAQDFNLNEDF